MIGKKIIDIMSEIKPICKTEPGENGEYKTPKVEKIVEMVQPLLIKYKVCIIPVSVSKVIIQGDKVYITMKYQFIDLEDEQKDYIEVEMPGGGFDETGGRAMFTAATGAYGYAIQEVFAIPITEEKPENSQNKTKQVTQQPSADNHSQKSMDSDNMEIIDGMSEQDIETMFAL